jgi:hypothetical protein
MPLHGSSSVSPVSASQSRPLNAVPLPLQWFSSASSLVLEASTAIPRLRATTGFTKAPAVSLIGAAAFKWECSAEGSVVYTLSTSDVSARSASGTSTAPKESPAAPTDPLAGLPEEYQDFSDVFSEARSKHLAPHRPYDLKIELEEGTVPRLGPVYSLSPPELKSLRNFIDKHLSLKFIQPSTSPFGALVLFVKKKDGSLRLCVDYCALNKTTKKDRYPLPLIGDLLDVPRKAKLYTKLDLRHAYHLVRIAEGDKPKTAFRTRYGSFEWNVIPFGLTNAPATFQRFINDIFADLIDVSVVCYLDDILIYSRNEEDHKRDVREVLRRLQKHKLYARADKCEFSVTKTEYLGFILSPDSLRMDNKKIAAICDWPTPRKIKEVQSFLGFANFYRRFIFNYSDLAVPLNALTRKENIWFWSPECQQAFDTLKAAFTSKPILTHWMPDSQLIVETDASDYAVAAILSWICRDGELRPIAFHSRSLQPAERNYDVHNKELWKKDLAGSHPRKGRA